ncbi:MAG: protein kinase domain-containing protein [Isosphaeraceae bacterium]
MSQIQALIGETLGTKYPYRIESVLGSGAMGVVYRATDVNKGRPAAVKVVSGELAQGKKVQERFEREAKILQQFRHPNIVRFLGYGKYRGTYYIAMEFIQGGTLEKYLNDVGPMPWREVVALAAQVCDALHYAHERGVVHRDLKPSNLMITEDHKVKLTDFGIAKDLDATSLTATGRTLGTAAYMAPEQIRGTPAVSHKTDLYALGVVLYQMLVGKSPFEGTSPVVLMHCHLNEPVPRPSAKVEEIPRALDDLVVALMAKAPADRPWDAAAVGVILTELRDKVARGESVPMVWPSAGSPAANPPRAGASLGTGTAPRKKKARKNTVFATLTGTFLTTRSRTLSDGDDGGNSRRALVETLLLLAALVAIGGLIVYLVWPPGQEYLYKHAETLMASTHRHDWMRAKDEYIDPLDRRFPRHPYREQTARWRDKILLNDAESRAVFLVGERLTPINEPKNNAEQLFRFTNELAARASRQGDDRAAWEAWKRMAASLKPDDQDDRMWYLLAIRRAEQLETAMQERRKFVETQLRLADEALRAGRPNQAITIRSNLYEQYGGYADLHDLLPKAAVTPAAESAPSASPAAPAGTSPETTRPSAGALAPGASPQPPPEAAAPPGQPARPSTSSPPSAAGQPESGTPAKPASSD